METEKDSEKSVSPAPIFSVRHLSIYLSAVYGVALRLMMQRTGSVNGTIDLLGYTLSGITFMFVVPFCMAAIPIFFATDKELKSGKTILQAILSVLLFFVVCIAAGIETLLCVLIISLPYLLGTALGAALLSWWVVRRRARKKNDGKTLLSVLLLPFVTGAIEGNVESPTQVCHVRSSVVVNASPTKIWGRIVRVGKITQAEYPVGVFQRLGVPRPLFAELDRDTLGAKRVGHFEGGLLFVEEVTEWTRNKKISLSIKVVPKTIGNDIFSQHILKNDRFRFLEASYELRRLNDRQTELVLHSSYELRTNLNWYAAFWGNLMLADFQERLLAVIKGRCNK